MTRPTPRQMVETALRGGHSHQVPFTIYESKIPQCQAERELRNRGLCIVNRNIPVLKVHSPNVRWSQHHEMKDGKYLVRNVWETPVGTLSMVDEPAGFTSWHHEKLWKSPEDYKALAFYLNDETYEPNYQPMLEAMRVVGDDIIFRAGIGLEPLQTLISGGLIGMEDFCAEWMINRDEILKLYEILVRKRREQYAIIAQSPALICNYGGNVVPEIIGLQTFEEMFVPHYNEFAAEMHRHGKLLGCHFDANCRLLAEAINSTDLDYIEAFTPAPDTDMTMREARAAWPDKVIWINFPSSQHLCSDEQVEAITLDLCDQAGTPDGFIMAVTEDAPEHRWRDSCRAIMSGLERHARENPALYA